ncbi:restriction endonuclease [Paenibacillus polymyxa]|uniref:nSTAND3 domain-containing NTPase n=1 Tax=Paenibacillus polymyxa TaxID=1406 RepID=UPI001BE652C9|nr:restriction endonuclease [Paenibacillus polymyxa]MBT2283626.1 restriction endonuclease [Paenibacillus polymyxa]
MFNYANLNDVEFEELCKDVMEKKLSTRLRLFSKGRDGGIDLTDNIYNHNIIIQVKHYIGSKFPNLRTSLKKEIDNVHKWKPSQYYICCGMQLTEGNTREIYSMFSDFMLTDQNIITLKEIDEFLQKPENSDIVRKHYKLWLYASKILDEIYNQNIFIDCETLLSDIEEECNFFVQTKAYEHCIEHLDKSGLLMITGGPGVGKTITSKMIVLYYATQGYRVRYTTNGDINDIKKSLSSEKTSKEIVLLDDCLGQHYFNMKQTQENELLSLIKFVKLSNNKKLILNSRITIFNEAKERSIDFNNFFQQRKIRNFTINMDEISPLEKAKIFYNHLTHKSIPVDYYNDIKANKNYLKIVNHNNYTPRIIEYVTYPDNYLKLNPLKYFEFIYTNLQNPNDIWKNEFDRRLQEVDRAFLIVLYSLTDTTIEYDVLKKCFENRLLRMKNMDYTRDNFDLVLSRLNQSIINVIDYKGKRYIGVINPSVNDYLKQVFVNNRLELNEVRNSICNFKQFERCYSKEDLPGVYSQLIINEKITEIDFVTEKEKNYFLTSFICRFKIKNNNYKQIIFNYLSNSYCFNYSEKEWLSHPEVLEYLLDEELYSYYCVNEFIEEENDIRNLLHHLDLDESIFTINLLNNFYSKNDLDLSWSDSLFEETLIDAILSYVEDIDVSSYCDNREIEKLLEENTKVYYFRDHEEVDLDKDAIVATLEKKITDDIEKEIQEKLSLLDSSITDLITLPASFDLSNNDLESVIDSYFKDVDDEYNYSRSGGLTFSEVEAIFEREIK